MEMKMKIEKREKRKENDNRKRDDVLCPIRTHCHNAIPSLNHIHFFIFFSKSKSSTLLNVSYLLGKKEK